MIPGRLRLGGNGKRNGCMVDGRVTGSSHAASSGSDKHPRRFESMKMHHLDAFTRKYMDGLNGVKHHFLESSPNWYGTTLVV